jgi:hypothetical protein
MNKTMTKASLLAAAFIVLMPFGLRAQDEGFYPYSFARLSYVTGTVYVQRASDLGYEKGEVNLALVQGDKMGTESGQAEIHFGRRNYLRIDDNTKIEFAVLPKEGDERIRLHLTEGSAYLRVSQLAVDKGIEVHTPDASFYVLEEGLYRFDVRLDRETQVSVREGSLEAAAEDGSVVVRANETVTAADGRLLGDPQYVDGREDGFDTWNGSRDALLTARNETQYLPSEIGEYEEELEENGEWVYERGYGNVWVPRVSYADWRPYLYGRWVWYPICGWTWVSSEPWGWATYHYGRWHWRFGLGWYWIPQHHWGPAWVHWWWNNDHIGWCPLSWYNRPVLLVDNHFYDRHYDRYYSPHNRAMTVVRRDQLQARDLARRQLGVAERGRIDRVEFRAEQPSLRPVVDNARPQALAARRALAARPGDRTDVRSVAPSNSLSPSRTRPAAANARNSAGDRSDVSRPSLRGADPGGRTVRANPSQRGAEDRGQSGVSGNRGADPGGRAIRPYPSQNPSGDRDQARVSEGRRTTDGSSARRGGGAETGSGPARVTRPDSQAPAPAQPRTVREPQGNRSDGKSSGSAETRKGETIKKYPSAARSESSSGRSQSRTYASRSTVSRTPSRLSAPAASPARTSPSVSRPSSSSRSGAPSSSRPSSSSRVFSSRSGSSSSAPARSSSPSYSRPGASRAPSSVPSRSSFSAPSRSSGSSGRTMSAPRASSSSSGRSYSAPRSSGSSSGRSYSAPRSSGSSGASRSVSSGRSGSSSSGSSSSRSSGSSSKAGGVKRKG